MFVWALASAVFALVTAACQFVEAAVAPHVAPDVVASADGALTEKVARATANPAVPPTNRRVSLCAASRLRVVSVFCMAVLPWLSASQVAALVVVVAGHGVVPAPA